MAIYARPKIERTDIIPNCHSGIPTMNNIQNAVILMTTIEP